jgi:hypothetical protein
MDEPDVHTAGGRFLADIYQSLRYPDPCYRPTWIPEANAGFFLDYARPRTITRFRYDSFTNLQFPDRAEFFWAQANGNGRGPSPPHINGTSARYLGQPALNVSQLYFYTEVAAKAASFFIEVPYRSLQVHPYNPNTIYSHGDLRHSAGFSDINLGTKSLLLDRELLQVTFQFRTYLPTGSAKSGLGTGHTSLEPSVLATLKLGPETYLQGQLAEWIPVGGDVNYAGAVIHYHGSLNQVLYRFTQDSPLIGTFEFGGWTFQNGLYTDPVLGSLKASGTTYFNLGPGLRMALGNRGDFGTGLAFPVTQHHWADPQVRLEFRIVF